MKMESFTVSTSTEETASVNRLKQAECRLELAQRELEAARIEMDEQSSSQFDLFDKSESSEYAEDQSDTPRLYRPTPWPRHHTAAPYWPRQDADVGARAAANLHSTVQGGGRVDEHLGARGAASCWPWQGADGASGTPHGFSELAAVMKAQMALPQVELEKFSGDPKQFSTFMSVFSTHVSTCCSDDRQRLSYLIQLCSESIRRDIDMFLAELDPSLGYQLAVKTLTNNYGQPHIIAKAHIDALIKTKNIQKGDYLALRQFGQEMRRCWLNLRRLSHQSDLDNSSTLVQIFQKLPSNLRDSYTKQVGCIYKSGRRPTFEDLYHFILDCCDSLNNEYGHAVFSHPGTGGASYHNAQSQQPPAKASTLHHRKESNFAIRGDDTDDPFATPKRAKPVCRKCARGSHALWKCRDFLAESVGARKEFIDLTALCTNCFSSLHTSADCPKQQLCNKPECAALHKHNRLLCQHDVGVSAKLSEPVCAQSTIENHTKDTNLTHSPGVSAAASSGKSPIAISATPCKLRDVNG